MQLTVRPEKATANLEEWTGPGSPARWRPVGLGGTALERAHGAEEGWDDEDVRVYFSSGRRAGGGFLQAVEGGIQERGRSGNAVPRPTTHCRSEHDSWWSG